MGTGIAIDVIGDARVKPTVSGLAESDEVIVTVVGGSKSRLQIPVGGVADAGPYGVGTVPPDTRASPQSPIQRGRACSIHLDPDRVADQDGVGHPDCCVCCGIKSLIIAVPGQGGVQEMSG